jgi:hypothetical protein
MPQPILYVAITNHGYGHATRTCSLVAEIQRRCPEILIILVTTASRPLLEAYIPGDFIHRPYGLDIGVVQGDSLTMDKPATLEKLKQIRQRERSMIANEVNFIRQNRVSLVLADIPPLAAAIAAAADIPAWMISNFGWDFIYRPWGGEFVEMADWIGQKFQQCDRLFRLPDRQYRPVDFMPLCGCVMSKPGYSTFAEACRVGVPVISITRDDFAEAPVLIAGIQDHAYHRILQPDEFFHSDWHFLEESFHPPRVGPLAQDGNETIAQAVIDYLQTDA